jgi:hypothetical protein
MKRSSRCLDSPAVKVRLGAYFDGGLLDIDSRYSPIPKTGNATECILKGGFCVSLAFVIYADFGRHLRNVVSLTRDCVRGC